MLVLSQKNHEKLHIGNDITVTVLSIRGGVVKLGIDAPGRVRILRGELPDWVGNRPHEAAAAHLETALTV